jgi:hypothetical protein
MTATQDPAWTGWLSTTATALILLVAGFWALESPGLKPGKGSLTLSWTLRRWLGVHPRTARRYVLVPAFLTVLAAVVGGAVWLAIHILVDH